MKVVTLRGTYDFDLSRMKVRRPGDREQIELYRVPSPVLGMRMEIETIYGVDSTEPVQEVEM